MNNKPKNRILIVDDEKVLLKTLNYVFENAGYEVIKALDGNEAVEKARNEKPDLIIMDCKIPGIDGWTATKKIRSIPECQIIPIIGYTAYSNDDIRKKGMSTGLNEILAKPLDVYELKSIVEDYLSIDQNLPL